MKKVELLSPAKNIKAIKAAADYADSVYFGTQDFNMRMRSQNIEKNNLENVVKFIHEKGLKAYLTTNILIYDNEIRPLRSLINQAYEAEIDAIIVHDFAAIQIAKEVGVPFHVSTQCNIANSLAARHYEKLGAERLILARELSLEKIKEIKRNLMKSEIEVFIHGAMCTSISGRCYFSQDVCGTEEKSANRGACIQPCRRRWWVKDDKDNEYIYDGVRFMNSRDLCTIAYIPELIEANIDAFKIEGRMRHPHYVEIVSKVYREAIESYYEGTTNQKKVGRWVTELKRVYNRGFTPGFLFNRMTEKDHQHNYPYNLSHYRYIKIGKIVEYDYESKIADISLTNGYLTEGDDIIIMGENTDTYIHQDAKQLYYKGKKIGKTPRGLRKDNLKVQMKVDEPPKRGGKDKVYIFTNRTYKSGNYSL